MNFTQTTYSIKEAASCSKFLTPNSRIARDVQAQLIREKPSQMVLAKNVVNVSRWVREHYLRARDQGKLKDRLRVLSEPETIWVWKNIVSLSGFSIHNVGKTAALAYSAFQLCKDNGIEISEEQFGYSEDCEAFQQWSSSFEQYLSIHRCVVPCCFLDQLLSSSYIDTCNKGLISYHDSLEMSALQLEFANKLSSGQLLRYSSEPSLEHLEAMRFATSELELAAAAHWAVSMAKSMPDETVAIVVSDLSRSRETIIRALRDVEDASHIRPMNGFEDVSFNVSLGQSYLHVPLVQQASLLLRFAFKGVSPTELYQICSSPYFPTISNGERPLKLYKRSELSEHISVHHWERNAELYSDGLPSIFESVREYASDKRGMYPSGWMSSFTELLVETLGWPGSRGLTSFEYQALKFWNSMHETIAKFDGLCGQVKIAEFARVFEHVAGSLVFHEESVNSNLHVLGAIEAEGQPFDHMWLLGADDLRWPAKADRNPFIPVDIQIAKNLPHCSADSELDFARKLYQSYTYHSRNLVCSYSIIDADGRNRSPSPLVDAEFLDVEVSQNKSVRTQKPILENVFSDTVPYRDVAKVKGGAYLFKDYIKCPFLAFANHRLGLLEPIQTSYGLNKAQQGALLHEIMKAFWDTTKSRQELLNQQPLEVESLLVKLFDASFVRLVSKENIDCAKQYMAIERNRQVSIAMEWIELERTRPDFVVVATEKRVQRTLAGVTIDLIVDRIDLDVASKRLIFWDYKTGNVSLADLNVMKPLDPQLPLYVMDEIDVGGLGYLKLSSKKVEAIGVVIEGGAFSRVISDKKASRYGIEPDWDRNIAEWKLRLEAVAKTIIDGHIQNLPVKKEQTCRNCSKRWLCRVDEIGMSYDKNLQSFAREYPDQKSGEVA